MIQKHYCLLQASAHLKWTESKRKTVVWSDESTFEILFGKQRHHIFHTNKEREHQCCVQKPASLTVWEWLGVYGTGILHILKGTIRA